MEVQIGVNAAQKDRFEELELPLGRERHFDVQYSQSFNLSLEERFRRKLILAGILPKFSNFDQGAIGQAIEAAGAGQFGRLHKEALDDSSI